MKSIARAKPSSASVTRLADLILPTHANTMGKVFGGKVLEMVDKAAGVCAMRHSGKPCVTVAMDRVEFRVPIGVGDFVMVEARLIRVGRTSMEIAVEVQAEDLSKGVRRHTNSCRVTMVAVDRQGRPSPVPPLKA
ncbi:MAG: acyl-CoA thioesterase [Elusimicrobia bacterium]|nr:acyl-CoA thioesterase [Elusimicrobiota bacterium]